MKNIIKKICYIVFQQLFGIELFNKLYAMINNL